MRSTAPHYLLMSETRTVEEKPDSGRWRFVLEQIDGTNRIEVTDEEPHVRGERLQLLAVLRGLEALEQPSRVTLVTPSRYVGKGLRNGLDVWRDNGWCWERFGEMTPIDRVIGVMCVIGRTVGRIDQLDFQQWSLPFRLFIDSRSLPSQNFTSKVETRVLIVAHFDFLNDGQTKLVM